MLMFTAKNAFPSTRKVDAATEYEVLFKHYTYAPECLLFKHRSSICANTHLNSIMLKYKHCGQNVTI